MAFRMFASIMLAALTAAHGSLAQARDVNLLTVEWGPYFGPQFADDGVIGRVARAAFAEAGYSLEIDYVSWNRAMARATGGEADGVLGAYNDPEREQDFHYSASLFEVEIGFVALADFERDRYESLADLVEYRIGSIYGYSYPQAIETVLGAALDPAFNDAANARRLMGGRIDLILENVDVAQQAAFAEFSVDPSLYDRSPDFKILYPPVSAEGLHILFSKAVPDGAVLRDAFDRGLAAIRRNGVYDRLIANFRRSLVTPRTHR